MRGDHRSFGYSERVVEGFVRNVGNVDHHAKAIQFTDDVLPECSQTIVCWLIGGGVRPVVVQEVCECEIANAERSVKPQKSKIVINHMAAFHTHQRGDLVFGGSTANVI